LISLITLGTWDSGISTLRTLGSLRTLCAFSALVPLITLDSIVPLVTLVPLCTLGTLVTLGTWDSGILSGCPLVSLGTLCAFKSQDGPDLALRAGRFVVGRNCDTII